MSERPRSLEPDDLLAHSGFLRALARGLLGDEHGAEDVVQETWLAVLQRPPRPGSRWRAWLAVVTERLALQRRRVEARRLRREERAAEPEALPSTDEVVARLDIVRRVVDAVRALEEPYRTTVLLHYLEDLPCSAIARREHLPAATVRTRLRRALELLRERLDAEHTDRRSWSLALLPLCLASKPAAAGLAGVLATTWGAIVVSTKIKIAVAVIVAIASGLTIWEIVSERSTERPASRDVSAESRATTAVESQPHGVSSPAPESRDHDRALGPQRSTVAAPVAAAEKPAPAGSLRVSGRVMDAQGNGLAAASVRRGRDTVVSNAEGDFTMMLADVRGELNLEAQAPGFALRSETCATEARPEVRVDFHLKPELRISGVVRDALGNPVMGASVCAFSQLWRPVRTDEHGRYVLEHLDPDRQREVVIARREEYSETLVDVAIQGRAQEVDLVLERGTRVEGVVLGPNEPVSGAVVQIGFGSSQVSTISATAGVDGRFVFPSVPEGSRPMFTQGGNLAPDLRQLSIAKGTPVLSDVVIRLEPPHFLAGRVVDDEGVPIAEVTLIARVGGFDLYAREITSEAGEFRFGALPSCAVALSASKRGYLGATSKDLLPDRADVIITLPRTGRLAGRVVDGRTGEPIEHFQIRIGDVRSDPSDGHPRLSWERAGTQFEDPEGLWQIESSIAVGGQLCVEVTADGYAPAISDQLAVSASPDPDELVIELVPPITIGGRVVAAATGAPVPDVVVKLVTATSPLDPGRVDNYVARPSATTDASGAFRLTGAPRGEVSLAVLHPEFRVMIDGPFVVPDDGLVPERTIRLERGGTIEGLVVDEHGKPVAGASVALFPHEPNVTDFRRIKADDRGQFRFAGLAAGKYQVSQYVESGSQSVQVDTQFASLEENQAKRLVLGVTSGSASLRGSVQYDGELPAHLALSVFPLAWDGKTWDARPRSRGAFVTGPRFEMHGLEPGEYRVSLECWDGAHALVLNGSANVTLTDGATGQVEIRLEASRAR